LCLRGRRTASHSLVAAAEPFGCRTEKRFISSRGGDAKRAFEAMMQMTKIDVAAIDAARKG